MSTPTVWLRHDDYMASYARIPAEVARREREASERSLALVTGRKPGCRFNASLTLAALWPQEVRHG